ncbi:MAG: FAD-dependent monooxygenase [Acidobacteriota bacterium]
MTLDFEILIVGAGPAGCAAGYDLAGAGKHVLLMDKSSFPRHKPCACGLTQKTLKALRYSVDPVIERVCSEIVLEPARNVEPAGSPEQAMVQKPADQTGAALPPDAGSTSPIRLSRSSPICAMAVRERFDAFCLRQTLASARNGGAISLRKILRIAALREGPEFVEVDVESTHDRETRIDTLRAPILIGADGANGQTRRLAGQHLSAAGRSITGFEQDGFALEATVPYSALPEPLPGGRSPQDLVFDFAPLRGGYGWLFPKADHVNIGVGAFASAHGIGSKTLKQITRELLRSYAQQKLGVTALTHITGQQLGMGGHNYIPHGRVLLTGDAAGLVDPLTGEGIHSAIVSGQAAAAAILELPEGERSSEIAAAYARHLRPLQRTLAFSMRAARAFHSRPERGFKAMRTPWMRSLILKTYAEGIPYTRLLTALAKLTT